MQEEYEENISFQLEKKKEKSCQKVEDRAETVNHKQNYLFLDRWTYLIKLETDNS